MTGAGGEVLAVGGVPEIRAQTLPDPPALTASIIPNGASYVQDEKTKNGASYVSKKKPEKTKGYAGSKGPAKARRIASPIRGYSFPPNGGGWTLRKRTVTAPDGTKRENVPIGYLSKTEYAEMQARYRGDALKSALARWIQEQSTSKGIQ